MKTNGVSLMVVIGKYGGFYIHKGHGSFRICLGWIAITFFNYDIEDAFEKM
jgi:hypothetical protein